jgi:metal-sulfur cluster biosynthetic enzyme
MTKEELLDAIRPVIDPEIGISIVDLGLIYDFEEDIDKSILKVKMTLTSPGCPAGPEIMSAVDLAVRDKTDFKEIKVELVWEPKWNPKEMASDAAKDVLGIW